MDLLTLYSILEDKTDDDLLLFACYFRGEIDKIFNKQSFNNLIQKSLINNETRFKSYFRVSLEYVIMYLTIDLKSPNNRVKKFIYEEESLLLM